MATEQALNTRSEIAKINLAYLNLAQRLLLGDRLMALFLLSIDDDVATKILELTPTDVANVAQVDRLICSLRSETKIFDIIRNKAVDDYSHVHASMLSYSYRGVK